jgi:hypothetical protein
MSGYNIRQFNNDMKQLGGMIDNFYNSNGGANNMSNNNMSNNNMSNNNMSNNNMSNNNMSNNNMSGGKNYNKSKSNVKNKSPKDKSPKDKSPKDKSPKDKSPKDKSPKDKSPKDKSPKDKSPKEKLVKNESIRRFKVITVDGNPYPFYRPYKGAEPKDAAKKAGKRICDKLYDNKGKNCKLASFELKETTRGSQKRVYGPYVGEFKKLATPRKLKFKGKPEFVQTHRFVVKLKK